MHCAICDKDMTDKEVIYNEETGTFEPCTVCLDIALDAAYSDGFSRDDEDDRFVLIEDEDDGLVADYNYDDSHDPHYDEYDD